MYTVCIYVPPSGLQVAAFLVPGRPAHALQSLVEAADPFSHDRITFSDAVRVLSPDLAAEAEAAAAVAGPGNGTGASPPQRLAPAFPPNPGPQAGPRPGIYDPAPPQAAEYAGTRPPPPHAAVLATGSGSNSRNTRGARGGGGEQPGSTGTALRTAAASDALVQAAAPAQKKSHIIRGKTAAIKYS